MSFYTEGSECRKCLARGSGWVRYEGGILETFGEAYGYGGIWIMPGRYKLHLATCVVQKF